MRTGKPLDDVHLLPEVSILFMAGFESEPEPYTSSSTHACAAHHGIARFMMVSSVGVCERERETRADTCLVHAATGHTAAWTVYSLSQHPEVEARLAAELAQHGLLATATQPTPRPIEWDDIPKLTYLQAVIKVWAAPGKQPKHPCFAAPKGLLAVPIHCTSARGLHVYLFIWASA